MRAGESGRNFFAITPSDSVNFQGQGGTGRTVRGIYVGGTGDVVAINGLGTAVTFSSVPAGTLLPIHALRVNSTSTTATNMVGIY